MNDAIKAHLVSALQTFVATFLTVLGSSIAMTGTVEWSAALIGALALAAVRAAVKELFANFAPPALGGVQKA